MKTSLHVYILVFMFLLSFVFISSAGNTINHSRFENHSILHSSHKIDDIKITHNDIIFRLIFADEIREFSLNDLKNFDKITGTGGWLKVTGDISGPFEYTGVSITQLVNEFSNLPDNFNIITISNDGYLYSYSYDQILGKVMVYDQDGNEHGIGGVNMILAYEENGEPLEFGGPLRIAWINDQDAITDAFLWSKFVEEIEILNHSGDYTPPIIEFKKPENAIYFFDKKILPYSFPLIIGDITIVVDASDLESGISQLMILTDYQKKVTFTSPPYSWKWDEYVFGGHLISLSCYDGSGNIASTQKNVNIFNIF